MSAPRPFLKWVGGKRTLVEQIAARGPKTFDRYFEPFLGGGALFFALEPRRAYLSDANDRLVRTYKAVRNRPAGLIRRLRKMLPDDKVPTEAEYLAVRDACPDEGSDIDVASWLIFCNRIGFKGLYRVNKSGGFNVPYGAPSRPRPIDEANLRGCSAALKKARIATADFAPAIARVKRGDFVYLDPPYDAGFTAYTAGGFGDADQVRLRDAARKAAVRGASVLVSNAMTPRILELYAGVRFDIHPTLAPSAIGSDGATLEQVIIHCYGRENVALPFDQKPAAGPTSTIEGTQEL